ncbi:sigma-E factor negative regulatory protein [Thiocystis violacea]|uniref:sigma-E factor negative regulatory protein n=1 Tax=Thiocystis violacea TaxID=13725 RepID=UPI0019045C78|nr:sigma-E factor negative regulatory protein [Thiocystis violacea]MBK1717951.1 hypothetical protein [Thiocystis violacea]
MTDEHRQRLSDLQDGELASAGASDVLNAIAREPELRETWERYNLIGHAIRGEAIDPACRVVADRVRLALVSEPTILAPRRLVRSRRQQVRRLAGLALVASVAFVVFLAMPTLLPDPAAAPGPGSAAPRLVERESIPMRRWHMERPELASKLDLYLVTHQATAPATGANGMLPYATLVGYESFR